MAHDKNDKPSNEAKERPLADRDRGTSTDPDFDNEDDVVNWLLEANLSIDERRARIDKAEREEAGRDGDERGRVRDAINGARSQPGLGGPVPS